MEFKVRYFRKKNGDTLKDLAEKIDCDVSNLSKIERGVIKPTVTQWKKISDVYQIALEDLIDNGDEQQEDVKLNVNLNRLKALDHYDVFVGGQLTTEEELYNMKQSVYNLRELKETARIPLHLERQKTKEKYNIMLDDEEINEHEWEFVKQCIRNLRTASKKEESHMPRTKLEVV